MRGYGRSSVYTRHEDYRAGARSCRTCSSCWRRSAATRPSGSATTGAARSCGTWRPPSRAMRRRRQPVRALPADGFTLDTVVPLVDRAVYPEAEYPAGQWDYQFSTRRASTARERFEANVPAHGEGAVPQGQSRRQRPAVAHRDGAARWRLVRRRRRAPDLPRDADVLTEADLDAYVAALTRNGFFGPDSWYMNHNGQRRLRPARAERRQLSMPVLFLHGAYDYTCETMHSRLAEPMRRMRRPHRGRGEVRPLDGAGEAGRRERRARQVAGDPDC